MPRPVILGVVGDSAAGKTTITRGLVRLLGEDNVTTEAKLRKPLSARSSSCISSPYSTLLIPAQP